ncbi:MAG: co-chaperone GroES [Patescibacteria group bacterium]|jgi:chaperonin GroES
MKIQPLGDRILVKPMTEEETTKSGIILPDTVDKEKKAQGEILAIGKGEKIAKLELKEGDKVIFGKYAGDEIELDDKKEYKFLKYDEILAVIK